MFGIKILEEVESPVNGRIQVIKALGLGTYIQADGITQSGGIVESFWKKALKKVKSQKLKVKSCLILGLGGGSAAKWVRKLWPASPRGEPEAEITGVDIDPIIVDLGKKYLGVEVDKEVIADAEDYLKKEKEKYNLVLVDLYIGDNYPKKFESEVFLKLVLRLLTVDGVVVFNRLCYRDKRPEAIKFGQKLQKYFSKVDAFYPEANIMYICS